MEIRSKEILQPAMSSTKSTKDTLPALSKEQGKKDLFGEKLESALSADSPKKEELKKEKTLTKDKKTSKKFAADVAPLPENTRATKGEFSKTEPSKTESNKAESSRAEGTKSRQSTSPSKDSAAATSLKTEPQNHNSTPQKNTTINDATDNKKQTQSTTAQTAPQAANNPDAAVAMTPTLAPQTLTQQTLTPQSVSQTPATGMPIAIPQQSNLASPYDVGEKIANLSNLFPDATMSIEAAPLETLATTNTHAVSADKMSGAHNGSEAQLAALLGLNSTDLGKAQNNATLPETQAFAINRKAENFAQNPLTPEQLSALTPAVNIPGTDTPLKANPMAKTIPETLLTSSNGNGLVQVAPVDSSTVASQKQAQLLGQNATPVTTPQQSRAHAEQLVQPQATTPQNTQTQANQAQATQAQTLAQSLPQSAAQSAAQFAPKSDKPLLNTNAQKSELGGDSKNLSLKDESMAALTASAGASAGTRTEEDKTSQDNARGEKSETPALEKSLMGDSPAVRQQRDTVETKEAAPVRAETTESLTKGAMHRAVQTAARLQAQGGGTARIQLNDSKLGNIDLRVTVAAGSNVHIEIKSKDQKLRDNLESRMDDLRSSLGQHKLNLSECRVISETAQARNETENRSGNRPDAQTQQQQQSTWSSPQQQNSQQRRGETALPGQFANEPKPAPKQANAANIAPKTNIQRGANGSLKVTA